MIKYKKGDVLKCNNDILVNTVNDKGIMGGGIALQFAKKYPEMEKDYIERCKDKDYEGNFYVLQNGQVIYNMLTMPTKELEGYELIEKGFLMLLGYMKLHNLKSCAMPWVGCGIAGLEKEKVKDIIEEIFAKSELIINVLEY